MFWGSVSLVLQQREQEGDVAHGQSQDLILAQLLLRRMSRDELPELRKRRVNALLTPALAGVTEHLTGHDSAEREKGGGGLVSRFYASLHQKGWGFITEITTKKLDFMC